MQVIVILFSENRHWAYIRAGTFNLIKTVYLCLVREKQNKTMDLRARKCLRFYNAKVSLYTI